MRIRYAFQEQEKCLPPEVCVPAERGAKPWGTGHAVLCAAQEIGDAPFAVINADDYYGKSAFRTIFRALSEKTDVEKYDFCMVGYYLKNTVSDHGSVARGVCTVDDAGHLTRIRELLRIEKYPGGIHHTCDGVTWEELSPDSVVSMNLFGFTPVFLRELAARFPRFLREDMPKNPAKSEFLLPNVASDLLHEGKAVMQVLSSADRWYGVTYAADKPAVVAAMRAMTDAGLYPDGLWETKG